MFLSLLIILVIALIAGAFFLGNSSDDANAPLFKGLSEIRALTESRPEQPPNTATVYKWQDKDGAWHFSNTPPPEGVASQVQTYRTDENIIRVPRQAPPRPASKPAKAAAADSDSDFPIPGLPTPAKVKKALDDARAVQELATHRKEQLDRHIEARE